MSARKYALEEIHAEIVLFVEEHGYSPTIREIADICGMPSTSVAHRNLRQLRDRGLITFADGQTRTIRPIRDGVAL